jgi:hypothetical protein
MPPRHTYWTIIFGGQPTAFRSASREDLLPTFKQIQSKHPDAVMKWFARGKLWASEEEAHEALRARRQPRPDFARRPFRPTGPPFGRPPGPPRPWGEAGKPHSSDQGGERPAGEGIRHKDRWRDRPAGQKPAGEGGRGRDWRPGGEHKDPRDRFKVPRDVKRARFKANLGRDRFRPGAPPPGPPKPRTGDGGKPGSGDGAPKARSGGLGPPQRRGGGGGRAPFRRQPDRRRKPPKKDEE